MRCSSLSSVCLYFVVCACCCDVACVVGVFVRIWLESIVC